MLNNLMIEVNSVEHACVVASEKSAKYIMVLSALLLSSERRNLLTAPKYRVTWKTLLLPTIGIVAFFIYIYLFNVDIRQIVGEIGRINLNYYLIAAIVSIFDVFFFALSWHSLLRFLRVKFSVLKSFALVWVSLFIDALIPAESVSGELAKIYYVNKEQDGTAGQATASVVAQRLIGMGINIATLLVGAIVLLVQSLLFGMMLGLILFLITVICLFFVLILFLSFREEWTFRMLDSLIRFAEWISRGRWKLTKFREEVIEIHKAFHVAIKEYIHAPKTMLIATSCSVVAWLLSILIFYFTFLAVGYTQISWVSIVVVTSIFVAVKSVPIGIPFEVGLPEITLTTLLVIFGVPGIVSATVTILTRLLTLWLRFFIGFIAQQWLGLSGIVTRQATETSLK
jgi:uncharacterized protein (TIRG00374 family)